MKKEVAIAGALSVVVSLSGAVYAQRGDRANRQQNRQERQEERQNRVLPGRIVQGTLKAVGFAPATVTILTAEGETILATCGTGVEFHYSRTGTMLMDFYKNAIGKQVAAEMVKADNKWTLRELWDDSNWSSFVARHNGVKSGGIVSKTHHVLKLSGDLRYTVNKDTRWVKGDQTATPESFSVRDTVYIKAELKDNVPTALTVADTQAGAESAEVNQAPLKFDGATKKKFGGQFGGSDKGGSSQDGVGSSSQGNTRPPSNGSSDGSQSSSSYKIRMFLKVTDSLDNATEGVPGAYGQAARLAGLTDKKVECFGELRANGQLLWQIDRKDSKKYQRQAGQTITILPPSNSPYRDGSNWVWNSAQLSLTGALKDDDKLTSDDMLYQWLLNLDLAALAGQGEKVYKSTGSKAELHIVVTR